MDILSQTTQIVEYIAVILTALLALDNAVDSIAKMFGDKEIDTICGKAAIALNAALNKVKPSQGGPNEPVNNSSGSSMGSPKS